MKRKKGKWIINPEWIRVGEEEKKRGWGLRHISKDDYKCINIGSKPKKPKD